MQSFKSTKKVIYFLVSINKICLIKILGVKNYLKINLLKIIIGVKNFNDVIT